jgi:hypothetical protein
VEATPALNISREINRLRIQVISRVLVEQRQWEQEARIVSE